MLIIGLDPGLRNIGIAALSTLSGSPIRRLPAWRPHSVKHQDTPPAIPVDASGWFLHHTGTINFPKPPKGLNSPSTPRIPHDGNNPRGGLMLGVDTAHAAHWATLLFDRLNDDEPIIAVGFERIPWQLNRADGEGAVGAVGTTMGAVIGAIEANVHDARHHPPLYAEANQIRVKQWACDLSSDVTQKVPETAPYHAARRMVPDWLWAKGTDHSLDAVLVALYTLAGLLAHSTKWCKCGLPWGVAGWTLVRPSLIPRRWCPRCGTTNLQ